MEVEDNISLSKANPVENGDDSNHDAVKDCKITSKSPVKKKSICNGDVETSHVLKNGDHSKDSDLNSISNLCANVEDDVRSNSNTTKGNENGVASDESNEVVSDMETLDAQHENGLSNKDENGVMKEESSEHENMEEDVKEKSSEHENMEGDVKEKSTEHENMERGVKEKSSEHENMERDVKEKSSDQEKMEGDVASDLEGNKQTGVGDKGTDSDSKSKSENSEKDGDEEMPILVKEKRVDEKSDSEKENAENQSNGPIEKCGTSASGELKSEEVKDSGNDDVEIIGESTVVKIDSPSVQKSSSNVILMTSGVNQNLSKNSPILPTNSFSPVMPSMPPGFMLNGRNPGNPLSLLQQQSAHAPPKPKSSLDQIELIRWEIQNRLNTRPKYFKPNPSAELGPLAKFLFDIGSNLIKEAVYHELVKIQSKKNEENSLTDKEKEDLDKLKDIERDLHGAIGHLKLKMRKKCKVCHFQTESGNVIYHHKQFPHEDGKNLQCTYCHYVTKQPMNFKFHLESEHGVQPRLHDRKAFFECDLCPYENNQEQKLNVHKQRCLKQFRPLFNLHPSCLSGAEINLCLENIFYKPVVPKNLKILQAKHAQQQAALAEARRQQAEVQALAAQKNAAALAARRQQRQMTPAAVAVPPRYNTPSPRQARPQPIAPNLAGVRYNSRPQFPPQGRGTVANMLKDRKEPTKPAPHVNSSQQNNAPGGFEVCEICGGYVKDRKALRIHFFYAHRIDLPFNLFDRNQPPLYCATCYVRFWTAQGLRKHIDVHVQEKKVPDNFMGEGVHGKCISCGQLVGNIVVHMRVVHNREIHHYINALMCMFCGASFNNRPNVERHIAEVHGTIDIATGAVKVKPKAKSNPPPQKQAQSLKKSSSGKDSLVKGSVCVLCNLNFGRNVDLTRHCMRMHHTCMKCGMVVIDKASLLKHTCLSSPSGTRDCSMCSETGFHPAYYVKHLRDKHLKKFSVVSARVSAPIIEKWIKRPYPFEAGEDDPVEISDSEEESSGAKKSTEKPPVVAESPDCVESDNRPKKKARIGPASKIGRERLADEATGSQETSSGGCKRRSSEAASEKTPKKRK